MSMKLLIQQMKSRVTYGNSVMAMHWEENLVAIFLSPKNETQLKSDWFYIAWNVWHAARFGLPAISSTFKGVFPLNACIFWSFRDGKTRKMALTSLKVYKPSHPLRQTSLYVSRHLATGPNFGSSETIGSLKGQSEMTLNGMSSDPNNAVNQFGSDFNEIDIEHDVNKIINK